MHSFFYSDIKSQKNVFFFTFFDLMLKFKFGKLHPQDLDYTLTACGVPNYYQIVQIMHKLRGFW